MAYRINRRIKSIQIYQQIYPRICKCRHTPIMISIRINMINANRIRSQCLHQLGVELALCGIREGIGFRQLICNSCFC